MDSFCQGLSAIVGSEGVISQTELLAIAGRSPKIGVAPQSEEEISALLEQANGCKAPVVVWGGGTEAQVGRSALDRYDWTLCMNRMDSLVDYQPADLVVTAQAGMNLKTLQSVLSEYQQTLPWNPPQPERSTLGGIIASARSGSWRFGHGVPRDRLLAMRAVRGDGMAFKSGAKVVKSVAGFDIHRLFCGSRGTLGIITEVTLKVAPLPERSELWGMAVEHYESAEAALSEWMAMAILPDSLDLLNPDCAARVGLPAKITLLARFSGFEEAVRWQTNHLKERGYALQLMPEEVEVLLQDIPVSGDPLLHLRLSLKSSDTAAWMDILEGTGILYAHAGSGILHAMAWEETQAHRLAEYAFANAPRWLTLRAREPFHHIAPWKPDAHSRALTQRIKSQFDPQSILL